MADLLQKPISRPAHRYSTFLLIRLSEQERLYSSSRQY